MHNVEVFVNYDPPCNSVSTARRLNKRTMNDDDEITKPLYSIDAKDSHVLSGGSPSTPEVKATPGPSGISLLAAVEGMDRVESENESVVNNVTVNNNENITEESSSSMDDTNEINEVKDNVINVVEEKEINIVKENEINVETSDLGSQESGSMECSNSLNISNLFILK